MWWRDKQLTFYGQIRRFCHEIGCADFCGQAGLVEVDCLLFRILQQDRQRAPSICMAVIVFQHHLPPRRVGPAYDASVKSFVVSRCRLPHLQGDVYAQSRIKEQPAVVQRFLPGSAQTGRPVQRIWISRLEIVSLMGMSGSVLALECVAIN